MRPTKQRARGGPSHRISANIRAVRGHRRGLCAAMLAMVLLLTGCTGTDSAQADAPSDWVGSWSAAPYGPYPAGPLSETLPEDVAALTTPGAFQDRQARDQSFRMVVHPSLGGDTLRLRLSNLKGDRPVTFEPVRVGLRALPAAGATIVPSTHRQARFDGAPSVTVPPGEEAVSDAIDLSFEAGQDLVVSFRVVGESGPMTWHAVSFDTQFVSAPDRGDVTESVTGAAFPFVTLGWFFLSGVDVLRPDASGAIVALGDSITDGAYQLPATNTRYPDILARRLQEAGITMGVLNQGINSNTVTRVGTEAYRGPPAVERFDRDVLGRAGVRSVLIFEGTNDLTAGADAETVFEGLRELVARARAAGLCVVMGTIPPRDDLLFGWDRTTMEEERQALNTMIRAQDDIAGIADFDAVLGNPLAPTRPNPALFFPDLLHPNSLGFVAMADAVPLVALAPPPAANCSR